MKLTDNDIIGLSELSSAAVDGRLTQAQKDELQEWLRRSEEAREFYVRFMGLSTGIACVAEQMLAEGSDREKPQPAAELSIWAIVRESLPRWAIPAVCCAVAIAAFFVGVTFKPSPAEKAVSWQPENEPTTLGIAVLTRGAGVVWADADSSKVANVGAVLAPGWLKLESGLLQIEFFSGARVLVEGPSEFQLISPAEAFCGNGKISVEVPPQARGFRIGAPQTTVVDLGTAFGLNVQPDRAELHVFEGEVELLRKDGAGEKIEILEGQGLRVVASGETFPFRADRAAFASVAELDRLSSEGMERRYHEWQVANAQTNPNATLRVHFDFASGALESRALRNRGAAAPGNQHGAIVGCQWTQGRWPGKGALEFKNISDRVRFSLGGKFDAITVMAWVRVDSFDHALNALMNCDGFDPGGFHWQISNSGQMAFSVKAPGDPAGTNGVMYLSPVVFTPERLGQWVHLAVAYSRGHGEVRFYMNGIEISRQMLELDSPLRIDDAELGNWNAFRHVPHDNPIRNLNGRMDEFALFSRALTSADIQKHFRVGRPEPEFKRLAAPQSR